MRQFYCNLRQLLQNASILLQNATVITKCVVYESRKEKNRKPRKCTTGPTATTVQSSKQLIVKLHAYILERGSEYNFEKVHFEPTFDLLTPIGPGQEFSRRQHIHSPKCLISA